jgi:hypothetical protein
LDPVSDLVVLEKGQGSLDRTCWHYKKNRNGEVAYLLDKGVVVDNEVLVAAPLDLETNEEEEDFLSFLVYSILHCLIRREHQPYATTMLVSVLALATFFCLFFGRPLQVKF